MLNHRYREMMKKIAVISIVVVAAIVAAELYARFQLGLGDPPLSEGAPDIDYIFKPNQRCRRFGNAVNYNNLSMRMDEDVVEGDSRRRVFVIGDSVINGGSLTDQGELATALLQRELSEFQVCNVSAGSWGPGNYAAYFRRYPWLVREGDILIVEMASHDIWEDDPKRGAGGIVGTESFPSRRPFCALWEGWTRYLRPRWFRAKCPAPKKIDAVPAMGREELEAFNLHELEWLYSLPAKRKCLLFFRSRAEAAAHASGKAISPEIIACVERLLAHAKAHGVEVLQADLDASTDFRDPIHPNAAGQRKLGEQLLRAMRDRP